MHTFLLPALHTSVVPAADSPSAVVPAGSSLLVVDTPAVVGILLVVDILVVHHTDLAAGDMVRRYSCSRLSCVLAVVMSARYFDTVMSRRRQEGHRKGLHIWLS